MYAGMQAKLLFRSFSSSSSSLSRAVSRFHTAAMSEAASTTAFKPLAGTTLFSPLQIGAVKLEHRIVQAPCTRMRGELESEGIWAPGDIMVEYYAQRASKGGLLLTEATNISRLVSFKPLSGLPDFMLTIVVFRIPRCRRRLHARPDCCMEACNRCGSCQGRLYLLPDLACWTRHCPLAD